MKTKSNTCSNLHIFALDFIELLKITCLKIKDTTFMMGVATENGCFEQLQKQYKQITPTDTPQVDTQKLLQNFQKKGYFRPPPQKKRVYTHNMFQLY